MRARPSCGGGVGDRALCRRAGPLEGAGAGAELALAVWNRLSGPTIYDQAKTVLAIIGTLCLVILFLRFGSGEKERYHEEEAE